MSDTPEADAYRVEFASTAKRDLRGVPPRIVTAIIEFTYAHLARSPRHAASLCNAPLKDYGAPGEAHTDSSTRSSTSAWLCW